MFFGYQKTGLPNIKQQRIYWPKKSTMHKGTWPILKEDSREHPIQSYHFTDRETITQTGD